MFDVDYVLTYVNNKEQVWLNTFKEYCLQHDMQDRLDSLIKGSRYLDMGLLPSLIMGIKVNMPWIRKIHIIVSNVEQVPIDIANDAQVNIVTHKDIIPSEYLPTFNSQTIEMFIPFIDGLSEHFIYGNDDMFPIGKLQPSDFFNEDGTKIKVNIRKYKLDLLANTFRKVCLNNTRDIIEAFEFTPNLSKKEYYRPYHSVSPMIKSHCMKVWEKCKTLIENDLGAFRTSKQHNQYIFLIYSFLSDCVESSPINFKYVSCANTPIEIINNILDKNNQIICINDNPEMYRSEIIEKRGRIVEAFNKRLSNYV